MKIDVDRSPSGTLESNSDLSPEERLGEERASRILERAAALDAKRSSEIEITQLREAAAAAGISPEAFDQAIREDVESTSEDARGGSQGVDGPRSVSVGVAPGAAEVARYAELLRDLLGDDARVVVVEDRIEAQAADGMTVSINPSSGETTAAILAEGALRRRLLAITLPIIIPLFLAVMIGLDDEEAAVGVVVGALLAVLGSVIATAVSDRRERKALRKKADRLRRQLQRMLGPGPESR